MHGRRGQGDGGIVPALRLPWGTRRAGCVRGVGIELKPLLSGRRKSTQVLDQADVLNRETAGWRNQGGRSEEHTSELQSLMRISYADFCLKTQTKDQYTVNQQ